MLLEGERAVGVELESGEQIHPEHVVSNADVWRMLKLLPEGVARRWQRQRGATPACSFLHLHLERHLDDLPIHTVWVGDWERGISAERNAVVVSIPSVLDPSMAPAGAMCCLMPANEPGMWRA